MGIVYEIVVKDELGPTVAHAFKGMTLETRDGETVIVGEVVDQSHLASILRRLHDLGLEILSIAQLHESGNTSVESIRA